VYVYNNYAPDDENKLSATATWTGATVLSSIWLVATLNFVFHVCVPEFRHTFWSTETGWQWVCNSFLDNEGNDGRRIRIFHYQRYVWEGRIGDQVLAWSHANWETWVRTQPQWFTEHAIATVPDEYIPARALEALGGDGRRRNSAVESMKQLMLVKAEDEERAATEVQEDL
jgi:hypothetical protein